MPFPIISDALNKIDQYVAHWTSVNVALGATPLILRGAYALANLNTDRTAIATAFAAVQTADNTRQIAASDRDIKLAALKEKLRQFRAAVQGQIAGTAYVNALPVIPSASKTVGDWFNAFDDMNNLWTQINAATIAGFTGPLKLSGGYLIAAFGTDYTALKTVYTAVTTATKNATIAREQRNDLLDVVYNRLKEYTPFVNGLFPAGHALIASLPKLSPPPGSTPKAVIVNAHWDNTLKKVIFDWNASETLSVESYSVRFHPGLNYKADEEQSVASKIAGLHFETEYGLPAAGSVGYYKVYAITSDGNEKGSRAVKIVRP